MFIHARTSYICMQIRAQCAHRAHALLHYARKQAHIHTHTHTHTPTDAHAHGRARPRTRTRTRTRARHVCHVRMCAPHVCAHTDDGAPQMHARTLTCKLSLSHARSHTHMHAHHTRTPQRYTQPIMRLRDPKYVRKGLQPLSGCMECAHGVIIM